MSGIIIPSAVIGLGSILMRPVRGFYLKDQFYIAAQITIEETLSDTLVITDHPVEQGAVISDHAYKRPSEVKIQLAWSDSPPPMIQPSLGGFLAGIGTATSSTIGAIFGAASTVWAVHSMLNGQGPLGSRDAYMKLIQIQQQRIPFNILTGKREYKNMLFQNIILQNDSKYENAALITVNCREVILTKTQVVELPVNEEAQGEPEVTTPEKNMGQKRLVEAS